MQTQSGPTAGDRPDPRSGVSPSGASSISRSGILSARVSSAVLLLAAVLTAIALAVYPLRYVAYTVPLLAAISIVANGRAYLPLSVYPYALLVVLACIYPLWTDEFALKDAFFIVSGLSIAIGVHGVRVALAPLTIALSLVWMVDVALRLTIFDASEFSFVRSNSPLESSVSFLFGVLGAVCAGRRQWRWVLLFGVLCLLSMKRVAFIGMLICVAVELAPAMLKRRVVWLPVVIVGNVLVVLCLLLYASGSFNAALVSVTGLSANQLGMGRQVLYSSIAAQLTAHPLSFVFVGEGPESAYSAVQTVASGASLLLHSDLLKVLYEYGAIAFLAFIALLHLDEDRPVQSAALYTNVLMITDNTLVYHFYIFLYVVLVASCKADSRELGRAGRLD